MALFADGTGPFTANAFSQVYPIDEKLWEPVSDGNLYWRWGEYRDPVPDPSMEPFTHGRHLDGYNFAFADGHAKFLRPTKTSAWYRDTTDYGADGQWHGPVDVQLGYFPGALLE